MLMSKVIRSVKSQESFVELEKEELFRERFSELKFPVELFESDLTAINLPQKRTSSASSDNNQQQVEKQPPKVTGFNCKLKQPSPQEEAQVEESLWKNRKKKRKINQGDNNAKEDTQSRIIPVKILATFRII